MNYESLDINKIPEKIRIFFLEEGFDLSKSIKRVDEKFLETYDIFHKKFGEHLKLSFIPELYEDLMFYNTGIDCDDVIIETYIEQIEKIKKSLEFKQAIIRKRFKKKEK